MLLDAEAILKAWTGRDVAAASASTARLISLALVCGFVVSPLRLVLRGCGRPGPEALGALCGSLLHVALALATAPLLGAAGVASSALVGAVFAGGIVVLGARRVAPALYGGALRALPAPLVSAAGGFVVSAALRLLASGWGAPSVTRAGALLRVLPEGVVLAGAALLVAWVTGAVGRDDAAALSSALLPGRPPRAVDPAAAVGAAVG